MTNLPSGTVTFLFTDIESSTKLAQKYPDEMPILLARHNEILNQAIQAHNGFVFRVVGDSFSAAFHTASDALNAALDAQRLLQNESWSPAPIKVRMGIHTGAAQLEVHSNDSSYSGYATLALTQRIMSARHGGQILLSQTAHDLTRDRLPVQAQFVDMGERCLKDVVHSEHLYQLCFQAETRLQLCPEFGTRAHGK
jgi:class 3 adenylate cyclase